ncbi:MAG: hypothetical protein CM1200mP30_22960 [Pseudomonadota bacterium]|nr:MAG: hypothetical protein CM1200mP30_22960 [Pseudomonadota bacterium]
MRSPRSYTTEDVVEIQCHGVPLLCVESLILGLARARLAETGEFTKELFCMAA